MSAPSVTVVVPVWGTYVEEYLPDALASIARQDVPTAVILVDNASDPPVPKTDASTVLRLASRVTLGEARNAGLGSVETDRVVFWDADDLMLPGTLRALSAHFENGRPQPVAAVARILEDPSKEHHWPRRQTPYVARFPRLLAYLQAVSSTFPTTGAVMIDTRVAREAGGFAPVDGGDDQVLGVSLAFRGRIVFEPSYGRIYRQHSDSLSAGWRVRPNFVTHARRVRERVRQDPVVPSTVRATWPLLMLLQWLVLFGVRPLARLVRVRRPRRPRK